jgi:hypothetical protein
MTKKDEIYEYIRRQIALTPELAKTKTDGLPGARTAFRRFNPSLPDNLLWGFLNDKKTDRRLIIMPGLRGVGKTTLMYQLYQSLRNRYENAPEKINILYVSADELVKILHASISDLFAVYEEMFTPAGTFLHSKEKYIFIIDEVHYDQDWAVSLKTIYDRTANIFLLASGSSALSLQKTADLARRGVFEILPPLSFGEYIFFKYGAGFPLPAEPNENLSFSDAVSKDIFLSDSPETARDRLAQEYRKLTASVMTKLPSVNTAIENYLTTGSFPSSLQDSSTQESFEMIKQVLEKVIMEDFNYYDPRLTAMEKENAMRLLYMLARSIYPRSTAEMGKELGMQASSVWKMLHAFEKAELVFDVKPYGSGDTIANKPWKYYFAAPSIAATILWSVGGYSQKGDILGALLENAVGYAVSRQKNSSGSGVIDCYYDYREKGADFVVTVKGVDKRKSDNLVLEVSWGEKGLKQVEYTMQHTKAKYGLVISGENEVKRIGNVVFVPKQLFLCL